MPARHNLAKCPADYLTRHGVWPDGPFTAKTPPEAAALARLARRLRSAMETAGLSAREVARRSRLSPQTVSNLLSGKTWGDLVTLYRVEEALGLGLWCDDHG